MEIFKKMMKFFFRTLGFLEYATFANSFMEVSFIDLLTNRL